MILLATFVLTMAGGSSGSNGDALDEDCQRLLSAALGRLTSESLDGRRYLAHDWGDRLIDIGFGPETGLDASASVEVRLFDHAHYELSLTGNISLCQEVRSASEPVILIDLGRLNPGEIIVKVGR